MLYGIFKTLPFFIVASIAHPFLSFKDWFFVFYVSSAFGLLFNQAIMLIAPKQWGTKDGSKGPGPKIQWFFGAMFCGSLLSMACRPIILGIF